MMNLKTKITQIHYKREPEGFIFEILKFCSLFYGFGSRMKNFFYDKKLIKSKRVPAFVISIGNMTTGGVGKTPVVAEIAKYLIMQGFKVAIISRGYGGRLNNKKVNMISDGTTIYYDAVQAGDEPYLLSESVPGCYVFTCKNRYNAAKYAIDRFGVQYIILDDGFQHRKLHRDLDIVLMDSVKGFGNEHLLPAGPLREGPEALDRIDKLLVVSKNFKHDTAEKVAKIMCRRLKIPTEICYTEPDYVYNIKTGQRLMEGLPVIAMSAIGQPQQFYDFLAGYDVIKTITFDDHHQYAPIDIVDVPGSIITTEKDAVKLARFDRDNIYALKLKTIVDVEKLLK
ncbi:tetraacyldisaccharide 4'-kinase [bacterium]|nr:tetraacyldisaccharide 4'-kinase [bacterium]